MSDELDPREEARTRRRDRDAAAEDRALMNPGMGKVFKQIQDAQAKAADQPTAATRRPRKKRQIRGGNGSGQSTRPAGLPASVGLNRMLAMRRFTR